ncbi:MAG: hypothetical protein AAGI38_05710 [Bacteroidota bacterium]
MQQGIAQGIELGIKQGIEQGIEQGIKQGIAQLIKGLLRQGKLSEQEIADAFSVEVELVRKIKKENDPTE